MLMAEAERAAAVMARATAAVAAAVAIHQIWLENKSPAALPGSFGARLGREAWARGLAASDEPSAPVVAQLVAQRDGLQAGYGVQAGLGSVPDLDTFAFQAPAFYEKQGYTLFGTIEDLPPGHARYFLQKRFA